MGSPTVIRSLAAVKDYVGVELPVSDWIPITQAYFNGVQSIMLGDATPQEAMDIAAEEIQAHLAMAIHDRIEGY